MREIELGTEQYRDGNQGKNVIMYYKESCDEISNEWRDDARDGWPQPMTKTFVVDSPDKPRHPPYSPLAQDF